MRIKKVLCAVLCSVMFVTSYSGASIEVTYAKSVMEIQSTEKASGINVSYRSKKQIRDYVKKHPAKLTDKLTYKKKPVVSGKYSAGELSTKTQKSALNMLKQIRYIAGISDDVTISKEYAKLAQAAALVNYANNQLSHLPSQPSKMDKNLYELGAQGAGSSNIAWASWSGCSLNETILKSWMEDGDDYNIDRVGHRRWLLNPTMAATGFGAVDGKNGTYSAVYAFDRSGEASEYGVAWPAQNMPTEYFGAQFPWSISTNQYEDYTKVCVTLTNVKSGKKWKFSAQKSNGSFYVNNDGYGQAGCIIFRPNGIEKYSSGDSYKVKITGLQSGKISYTVNFFKL